MSMVSLLLLTCSNLLWLSYFKDGHANFATTHTGYCLDLDGFQPFSFPTVAYIFMMNVPLQFVCFAFSIETKLCYSVEQFLLNAVLHMCAKVCIIFEKTKNAIP